MDDKKLEQIQNELMKEIDKEQKTEEDIISAAETIASGLITLGKMGAAVDGKEFMFAFKILEKPKFVLDKDKVKKQIQVKYIYMIVTDVIKYQIANGKYKPFIVDAEMDERYDLKANLKAAVEGFIRHITGRIKPEMLE